MSKNLYIAAAEAESGKSLIVLGIMNLLTRHIKKVGFFRPIIRFSEERDHDIEMVSKRFSLPFEYRSMYGMNSDEAFDLIHAGDMDSLFSTILDKYKKLEAECDFVLVEGTDYTDSLKLFEFDFNAHMANNIGAPVLAVVNGKSKSVNDISDMVQLIKRILQREKCSYLGMFVNRVEKSLINEITKLLEKFKTGNEINFVIPELDLLQKLTIRQISNTLKADLIYGDDTVLDYDVTNFKVGAMSIKNILKNTETGTLVITPGDRTDVLISLFMTLLSENHPKIAGILLTGGYKPDKELMKLIRGIKKLPVAICKVNTDTYSTALDINKIKAVLTPNNERKMAMAMGHFETFVSDRILKEIIDVSSSKMLTPIMFEYELFERARSKRKHIVLPRRFRRSYSQVN